MTMAGKKVESINKEIEKLTKSLERNAGLLEKKIAKCEKLNCNWSQEEYWSHRDTDMTDEQYGAWFDKFGYEREIEDLNKRLENAFARLEKAEGELAKVEERIEEEEALTEKENKWLEAMKKKQEEYEKWLAEFKSECLEDGIVIEQATGAIVIGTTPNGKKFVLDGNMGWTNRSRHCYTLKINGNTLFTSGLFSTGYRYIKNN